MIGAAPWRDVLLWVSDAQVPPDHSSPHVCCDNVAVSCCCEHGSSAFPVQNAVVEAVTWHTLRRPRKRRHQVRDLSKTQSDVVINRLGHWRLGLVRGSELNTPLTPSFLSKLRSWARRQGVWLGSTCAMRRRKDLGKAALRMQGQI